MSPVDSKEAEKLLRKLLTPYNLPTQYIATFRTKSGREIALERDRTEAFFVWVQKYTVDLDGVTIQNEKFLEQPYLATQSRNSNLNERNTPKLKFGKKAWYLKVDTIDALASVIDWYRAQ